MKYTTYPLWMRIFHMLGILFVGLAFVFVWTTGLFPEGSSWIQWHFLAGMIVLVLVIPRIIVRIFSHKKIPPITPVLTPWNQTLAHIGHWLLYLWMIVMPLLGWAMVSAKMGFVNIFGIHIPGIVGQSESLAKTLHGVHEVVGGLGLLLILGHIGMALYHHFSMKDDTLTRMFPSLARNNTKK